MNGKTVYVLMRKFINDDCEGYPEESPYGIFSTQEKAEEAGKKLDYIENQIASSYWFGHYDGYEIEEWIIDDMSMLNGYEDAFIKHVQKEADS